MTEAVILSTVVILIPMLWLMKNTVVLDDFIKLDSFSAVNYLRWVGLESNRGHGRVPILILLNWGKLRADLVLIWADSIKPNGIVRLSYVAANP